MLVVVSDFHLADGSAGEHNLSPDVYENFVDRLAGIHARVREHNPQSRVEIVYNGNIFDMLRTHFWFSDAGEHRPWRHFQVVEGDKNAEPPSSGEYLEKAVELFTRIMVHPNVSPIKGILGDRLADRFGGIEPLRLYIPGVTDRLINMHPGLRARVIDFLGLDLGRASGWDSQQRFPNQWLDASHGVLVRHGHEYDVYAFEGDRDNPAHYDRIPMYDLISCELFARMTYQASLLQASEGVTAEAIAAFRKELEQIDNVRPISSVVKWLVRHFKDDVEKKLLRDCLEQAVTNFESQPYVKWWLSFSGHDDWYNPLDDADRLERLLKGLRNLWLGKIGAAMKLYDDFGMYNPFERYIDKAEKEEEIRKLSTPSRYVVYGHTKHPQHVPLGQETDKESGASWDRHYINCGSMRPTHTVTHDGRDFNTTESLSFAVFFRADERPGATGPTHELWNIIRSRL